jgi:hypothetical protein
MKLLSLDKKLLTIQHRVNLSELKKLMAQHKVEAQVLENDLRRQLYQKFMEGIAKNIPTQMVSGVDGEEQVITYTISGYVLSQRDMLNVLYECLDMEDEMREKMRSQIKTQLGIAG